MWSLKATVVWVSYSFFEAKEVEEKISGRKGESNQLPLCLSKASG